MVRIRKEMEERAINTAKAKEIQKEQSEPTPDPVQIQSQPTTEEPTTEEPAVEIPAESSAQPTPDQQPIFVHGFLINTPDVVGSAESTRTPHS